MEILIVLGAFVLLTLVVKHIKAERDSSEAKPTSDQRDDSEEKAARQSDDQERLARRDAARRREQVEAKRMADAATARNRALEEMLSAERALINKFCEVAYRKVHARDEYGEERWDALDGEIEVVAKKLRRRHADVMASLWGPDEWPDSISGLRYEDEKAATIPAALRARMEAVFREYHAKRGESSPSTEGVDKMTGIEFEAYLMDLLLELGATEVSGTATSGDQGGDVLFVYARCRVVVQCKRYSGTVGNKAVQEAHAATTHATEHGS